MDTENSYFFKATVQINKREFDDELDMRNRLTEALAMTETDTRCTLQRGTEDRFFLKGDIYDLVTILNFLRKTGKKRNGVTRQPTVDSKAASLSSSQKYESPLKSKTENGSAVDPTRMTTTSSHFNKSPGSNPYADKAYKTPSTKSVKELENSFGAMKLQEENTQDNTVYRKRRDDVPPNKSYATATAGGTKGAKGGDTKTNYANAGKGACSDMRSKTRSSYNAEREVVSNTRQDVRDKDEEKGKYEENDDDSDDDEGPRWRGGTKPTTPSLMVVSTPTDSEKPPYSRDDFSGIPNEFDDKYGTNRSPEASWNADREFGASASSASQNCAFQHILPKTGTRLLVYSQDITTMNVDCVVNAANGRLSHGGGVAGAILSKAGPILDQESQVHIKKHGTLKTGDVAITSGGNMCKYVIHAVGPSWYDYKPYNKKACVSDLYNAFFNSLKEAINYNISTIAVPAISSGIFAVPLPIVLNVMWDAILEYDNKTPGGRSRLREIHLVNIKDDITSAIAQTFEKRVSDNSGQYDWNPEQYFGRPTSSPQYFSERSNPNTFTFSGGQNTSGGRGWSRGMTNTGGEREGEGGGGGPAGRGDGGSPAGRGGGGSSAGIGGGGSPAGRGDGGRGKRSRKKNKNKNQWK